MRDCRGPAVLLALRAFTLLAITLPAVAVLWPASARADWPPERRRNYDDRAPNEYLIVPAVASLPGFGVFVGVLGSGSNVLGTGTNAAVAAAESISGSDIHIQALALQEVPIYRHNITLDYQYADLNLGNYQAFLPGRTAPNFTIPVTQRFHFQLVRPALRLWERRITLTYSLGFVNGFSLDANGNEVESRAHSSNAQLALDFTDDIVNPVRGVRFDYRTSLPPPDSSFFGTNSSNTSSLLGAGRRTQAENFTTAGYLPLGGRFNLAGDAEFFQAHGGDPSAVVGGGSLPLRGYPGNRWSDRYGVFGALELRYTIPTHYELHWNGFARGIVEGWQGALFYEQGQVSPTNDDSLYKAMHSDYGFGVRMLLQAIVLRFDLAFSDEGPQTALTINQPF